MNESLKINQNRMSRTKIIVFMSYLNLFVISFSCGQNSLKEEKILFNYDHYQNGGLLKNKQDTSVVFINFILKHDFENARTLVPQLFDIDVSPGMIAISGHKPYLAGVGDYVDDFSKNSYDLLNLAVFLKEKFNANKELYDKILRGSLRLNSENLSALYLLAKLRYENGIENDAYYLILRLNDLDGDNPEIKRICSLLGKKIGNLDKELPTLEDFLRYDVTYYEGD